MIRASLAVTVAPSQDRKVGRSAVAERQPALLAEPGQKATVDAVEVIRPEFRIDL
jgi:hypothetical protein